MTPIVLSYIGLIGDRMIDLDRVSKHYHSRRVLDETSLSVPQGRAHALVGPSGCGKSTLLRLVMGLIRPDSGEVRVNGEPLRPDNVRRVRHSIGYVIQDGGLFPHLSAAQNVGLVARHLGWDRERISQRVEELTRLVEFPVDGLARYPAQLSGGQRQRVGLMRALMLDPPVLLMDEPLGALDPLIRARLQADLRSIFDTLHKTVLLVTHDMAEAAYLSEVVSVMRTGRIVQTGSLEELVRTPAEPYVTEFLSAQRSLSLEGVVQ
jgi:osmoprotectant transport system ATP-binding protein